MLVVLSVMLGIISFAVYSLSTIKSRARDTARVGDIKQIQSALASYYKDFGVYPIEIASGKPIFGPNNKVYLSVVPFNPLPIDGNCNGLANYSYQAINHQSDYTLYYCLGREVAMAGPDTGGAMTCELCKVTKPNPCGGQTDITVDDKTYQTVAIGKQCWLKQNLDVGTMLTSSATLPDDSELPNPDYPSTVQKWCYESKPENCKLIGAFYTWAEAMALPAACNSSNSDGCLSKYFGGSGWIGYRRGICPAGWHIPSDCEWQIMVRQLDPTTEAAQPNTNCYSSGQTSMELDSNYGWTGTKISQQAMRLDGLNLSLAGRIMTAMGSDGLASYGSFWTASQFNSKMAWRRTIIVTNAKMSRDEAYKDTVGLSVRCVKD